MTIKIVTDSSSDIPSDLAAELGITIVPLYVTFGTDTYRDGVDIYPDQFYQRLLTDPIHPTTSAASPGDFAEIYDKLSKEADEIISIHVSRKASATWDAAMRGKEMIANTKCRIEVIDSKLVTIALGLVTIAAAKAANAGAGMQSIIDQVNEIIPRTKVYGVLDTLKYIVRGGRLGKLGPLFSSVLPIKPLLTMKDGVITPMGVVRTKNKGMERLCELAKSTLHIKNVGVSHSVTDEEIRSFSEKIKSLLPDIKLTIAKLGPALGVHGGPGSILMALQQERGEGVSGAEKERKLPRSLPSLHSIKEGLMQRKPRDSSLQSVCMCKPLHA